MSQMRVLIVGASIAGPTCAYWFAKAGAIVTVIERFPRMRTGGQNIDIRTAGVSVMRKMPGMEAAVRAKIVPIDGISFVRSDGRPYGVITATGNPDQQSLVSEYEIYRGDLAQILHDLTKANPSIKYIFDEQVASLRQSEKEDAPVQVKFANGTPTSEYDLVVACDGATSRTRAIGLDCGVRDHMIPINSWAVFGTIKEDIVKGSKVGQAYSAVPGKFVAAGVDPSGGNRVTFMSIHPRNDPDNAMPPFREAMKQGDEALKQFVAQRFRGSGWKTDELLKAMMTAEDFYANEIAQVKLPSLHRGRFVLVGDAGYAAGPTGGGTTLALAGAYLLAGEVCKHKGNLVAGLNGYEEQMKPLIAELQKIPTLIPGVLAPQTAWGLWLRNNIFAFIVWTRVFEVAQKYFGGAFASAETFPLPEYDWES
ncbi:uncharacterized protein HMPREF1541_05178 [Cyphellophora europaea CBS 101466]|uniref:FAD-binding domain-containing protein n=1 Tax=Cyphellophora europaea (strain CBS 101466) TaxID=1220924 RepID=W2RYQ3_CYPE1|nr:uncharacterized protein HMPREF1541_05178 [Cyphellophora europaea CBS 101466]ETN40898.1 hypothetical protein HMPREF1541_05178 [Cyphellophora europaea CBS 101466]